jgi:histidinol-phosphate aminotransferase
LGEKRVVTVFDEAYAEYVNSPDAANGLNYISEPSPVIVLRTFSKIYGLAGLRVGYGLAQSWLIDLLNRVRAPFNVNLVAQAAAAAALHDDEHVQRSLRMNLEGMKYLSSELESLGFEVIPSQANFLTFAPTTDAGFIYEELLKKGMIVRRLASFGMPDHIRVTVGTPSQNKTFVKKLTSILKGRR